MNNNKIIPSIWFNINGDISEIISYYKNIFGTDFTNGNINKIGETPSGKTEICDVVIFEQKYSLMNTSMVHHPLNDAISLRLSCENQNEIDKYWDYFTTDGKASQCGWCIDKYGLRWQILPQNLGELMSKPNAFKVLMAQTKIIIADF